MIFENSYELACRLESSLAIETVVLALVKWEPVRDPTLALYHPIFGSTAFSSSHSFNLISSVLRVLTPANSFHPLGCAFYSTPSLRPWLPIALVATESTNTMIQIQSQTQLVKEKFATAHRTAGNPNHTVLANGTTKRLEI